MIIQKGQHPASGASSHSAKQREAKSSLEMERRSSSPLPCLARTGAVSTHHGSPIPLGWMAQMKRMQWVPTEPTVRWAAERM